VIATASSGIPGWYGKLPTLGDFASRRLPPEFIQTWDAWLQDRLRATQAQLGGAWLACYLTTPIWRFVLLPGLVGHGGWAGILMPSIDRVGRPFPLTIAVALPTAAAAAHAVFHSDRWFSGLEDAALTALDATRGPDDLDGVLIDRALVFVPAGGANGSRRSVRSLASFEAFESVARTEALTAWSQHAGWHAAWWTRGREGGDPLMMTCAGLPTVEEFRCLLESTASG
jgi:type VI secretion system protein ImpM